MNRCIYLIKRYSIRILCLTIFCFTCIVTADSKVSKAATIMDMQNKFPNGAYWNHVVQSGHGYSGYYHVGPCNNPDGYTWSPCNTHTANAGVGGYDCNEFGGAIQCCGFVKKLASDLYGSTHTSWGQTAIGNAKTGDVIHYYGGDADATNGHWAMIIGRSGNVLTLGECNYGSRCKINWGRTLNVGSVSRYIIYSAPWAATYGYNPQGCLDVVNGGQGNIQVRGWAFDRDNVNTAIKIHVYIGGSAGSGAEGHEISTGTLREDVNAAYPGVGNNHGFDTVIATNRVGEQQVYVYAINIGSGGNVLLGNKTVTIYPPATPTPTPTPTPTLTPTPITTPAPTMRPIVKPTIRPTVRTTAKPTIKPTTKPAVNQTVKSTSKFQNNKNITAKSTQDTYRNEVSAPGITTVMSCKSDKHGKVCIKWYKVASANGYQIQYSTKKNFVRKKTKVVYGSKLKLKLKSNKKYYVRVRAYRKASGNKVYGKWSKVKKIKVKK